MSAPAARDPRTALVTGANRGLGFETCRMLGAAGMRVLLTSRDAAAGERAAQALRGEGLDVAAHELDVARAGDAAALSERLARDGVCIDVLVNNAGVLLDRATRDDLAEVSRTGVPGERLRRAGVALDARELAQRGASRALNAAIARRVFAVNFHGVLEVTDALLPLLAPGAQVLMVSSEQGQRAAVSPARAARFADPTLTRAGLLALMDDYVTDELCGRLQDEGWHPSSYRTSKLGLNALTLVLARELAPRRLRVNAVCPGWVRTMGGPDAERSVEEGAASIVASALQGPGGSTGAFLRDGAPLAW